MTIFVDASPGKGLGVFASKDFKKGELIENCPIIALPEEDFKAADKTILGEYFFEWGKDGKDGAICLGYGSLYNHSHDPNAEFDMDHDKRHIVFKALRDIKKGEEICTDYGWDENDAPKTAHWFRKKV